MTGDYRYPEIGAGGMSSVVFAPSIRCVNRRERRLRRLRLLRCWRNQRLLSLNHRCQWEFRLQHVIRCFKEVLGGERQQLSAAVTVADQSNASVSFAAFAACLSFFAARGGLLAFLAGGRLTLSTRFATRRRRSPPVVERCSAQCFRNRTESVVIVIVSVVGYGEH